MTEIRNDSVTSAQGSSASPALAFSNSSTIFFSGALVSREATADRLQNGIEVDINTVAEMIDTCKFLGLDSREYLGDVDVSAAMPSYYSNVYKK